MIPQVDLARQHAALGEELRAAVDRVLGPEGRGLEAAMAALCGIRHAVGVASGTDALRLGLAALGIGPGDEVITPAFSFVASASTVLQVGALPASADVELDTFTLGPDQVARAVTPRTKAIIRLPGGTANCSPGCR